MLDSIRVMQNSGGIVLIELTMSIMQPLLSPGAVQENM